MRDGASPCALGTRRATPTSYPYDAAGRRVTMTDGTGTSTWAYDSLGRVTSYTNGAGETVAYGYDANGNVTTLTYPGATGVVTRTYDAANRLTAVTDWNGRTTSFTYDANGNLVSETFPGAITDTFMYNAANQMIGQGGATTVSYGRDNAGQLTSTGTQSYGYNALNQLTTAPGSAGTYTYDAAGNLTGLTSGVTQAFDAAGQLCWTSPAGGTGACASAPSGATTYTYNAQGQRVTSTSSAGTTTYAYNQAGELITLTPPSGPTTTYAYDASGLRATKTTGTATATFCYDTTTAVPALLGDGTNWYLTGPGGLVVEQIALSSGTPTFLHHDQLGSTVALSDASGTVIAVTSYDPYGQPASGAVAADTPIGFAGSYADAESGLLYLVNRYYDPATGQFTSVDPALALTQSPFAYVNDNPLNGVDPLGLSWWNPTTWSAPTWGMAIAALGTITFAAAAVTLAGVGAVTALVGMAAISDATVALMVVAGVVVAVGLLAAGVAKLVPALTRTVANPASDCGSEAGGTA